MITVSINGETKKIDAGLSVKELIALLNYTHENFAIAINTIFVARQTYEETIVKEGDTIDILAPVQGG
jgi:sulfur carrier protein